MYKKVLLGVFVLALIFTFGSINTEKTEASWCVGCAGEVGSWCFLHANSLGDSYLGSVNSVGGCDASIEIINDDDYGDLIWLVDLPFMREAFAELDSSGLINSMGDITDMTYISKDEIVNVGIDVLTSKVKYVVRFKTQYLRDIGTAKLLDPKTKDKVCKLYPTTPDCSRALQAIITACDVIKFPDPLLCDGAENLSRSLPEPKSVCPNNICEKGEDENNCPFDCALPVSAF